MTLKEYIQKNKDKYNFANPLQRMVTPKITLDEFLMLERISNIAKGTALFETASEREDKSLLKKLAELVGVDKDEIEKEDYTTLLQFAILATLELTEKDVLNKDFVNGLINLFGDTFIYALEFALLNQLWDKKKGGSHE